MNYERQFFQYLENLRRRIYAQPLNLGGVSSSGGGVGGPPGGFIGLLPQYKVTFDKLEAAVNTIPDSGASLLDNLNRIRYDIASLSGSGGAIAIQEDDVEIVSAATIINFEGGLEVTDEGGGKVTIVGTSAGVGFGFYYEQEDLTSQIPAGGDNYTLLYTPVSGTLTVHYNGITQQFSNYNILTSGVHTDFSPTTGDELLVAYSRGEKASTITVKSGSTIVSDVTTINLTNIGITDDGSGQVTIIGEAGGGGGTDAAAIHDNIANEITAIAPKTTPVGADEFIMEDSEASYVKKAVTFGNVQNNLSITESQISDITYKSKVSSNDTTADYLINKLVAGSGIVLTELNNGSDEDIQITVSGVGGSLEIQEDDAQKLSAATIINFEGDVTVTDEGGGKATITISGSGGSSTPDWYQFDAMGPPSSADSDDDEFEDEAGSGVPSGWTEFDHYSGGSLTVSENERGVKFLGTGPTGICGIYKTKPSSNYFSIEARVALTMNGGTVSQRIGICLMEGAGNTDNYYIWGLLKDTNGVGLEGGPWDDYWNEAAAGPDITYQNDIGPNSMHLRIRSYYDGLVSWYVWYDYSYDGLTWIEVTPTSETISFTPTTVGIFFEGNDSYFGYCDYFRVYEGSATADVNSVFAQLPLGGEKVQMFNDD